MSLPSAPETSSASTSSPNAVKRFSGGRKGAVRLGTFDWPPRKCPVSSVLTAYQYEPTTAPSARPAARPLRLCRGGAIRATANKIAGTYAAVNFVPRARAVASDASAMFQRDSPRKTERRGGRCDDDVVLYPVRLKHDDR